MSAPGGLGAGDRNGHLGAEPSRIAWGVDLDAVIVEELRDPESDSGRNPDERGGRPGGYVPTCGLDERQRRAIGRSGEPSDHDLADLEDQRDQRGDQLDQEEKRPADVGADAGEEGRNRRAQWSYSAARLVGRALHPDADIDLRADRPPGLGAPPVTHRASFAAGALGELLEAVARLLAASRPAPDSLPGGHHAAAIIIRRSGFPRGGPLGVNRFDGERRDIGAVRVVRDVCARARKGLFSARNPNSD